MNRKKNKFLKSFLRSIDLIYKLSTARMKGVKPMLFLPGAASALIVLLGAVINYLLLVT